MAHFTSKSEQFSPVDSDFSRLEGTCCYCSDESAARIRESIAPLPLEAIHMIGTGDYHYITLFWLEKIAEPFELILFDNHQDDQPTAFGGDILSCGSWVARARELEFCRADTWIRDRDAVNDITERQLPAYISVDLDVLSPAFARTGWDQGSMTLDELCSALSELRASRRIIGADICGGITESQGGCEGDFALNAWAARKTADALNGKS